MNRVDFMLVNTAYMICLFGSKAWSNGEDSISPRGLVTKLFHANTYSLETPRFEAKEYYKGNQKWKIIVFKDAKCLESI